MSPITRRQILQSAAAFAALGAPRADRPLASHRPGATALP